MNFIEAIEKGEIKNLDDVLNSIVAEISATLERYDKSIEHYKEELYGAVVAAIRFESQSHAERHAAYIDEFNKARKDLVYAQKDKSQRLKKLKHVHNELSTFFTHSHSLIDPEVEGRIKHILNAINDLMRPNIADGVEFPDYKIWIANQIRWYSRHVAFYRDELKKHEEECSQVVAKLEAAKRELEIYRIKQ